MIVSLQDNGKDNDLTPDIDLDDKMELDEPQTPETQTSFKY